jgi:hypothetical protein
LVLGGGGPTRARRGWGGGEGGAGARGHLYRAEEEGARARLGGEGGGLGRRPSMAVERRFSRVKDGAARG